jgi:hypothetical protein
MLKQAGTMQARSPSGRCTTSGRGRCSIKGLRFDFARAWLGAAESLASVRAASSPSPVGDQPHAGPVPTKTFKIVAALAVEDKKMPAERISTDHLLGLGRQAIKPIAQIDRATRKRQVRARGQADHVRPLTAGSTHDNAFSLTDASTLIRAPLGGVILNGSSFSTLGRDLRCRLRGLWRQQSQSARRFTLDYADRNELHILRRTLRHGRRLACR